MNFECPHCGLLLADPGDAFVAHLRASADCRTAYEHQSESTAEDWSKR
ncbi:MAG: DUF7501 family protein [Thermoplasmatota archaeon]